MIVELLIKNLSVCIKLMSHNINVNIIVWIYKYSIYQKVCTKYNCTGDMCLLDQVKMCCNKVCYVAASPEQKTTEGNSPGW